MIRRFAIVLLMLGMAGLAFSAAGKTAKSSDPLERRAFFGMGSTSLPDSMRNRIAPEKDGVLIIAIVKGRSAEKLGLQKGDVLLRLNGIPMHESGDVRKIVYNYKAGDKVAAEFWHNGKVMTSKAALTEYPKESSPGFDIVYDSFSDGDSLRRVIITKPKTAGKYPVIVLLPGVGAFDIDRNKDVYEYPLQELLYSLTKAGFVTVRMDKPGQGDSQGPATSTLTLDGEVNFFVNGLKALPKWNYMDPQQVILLAHSSGGYHAPLVAARYPVKGIIAVNTPGTGWYPWELARQRREYRLEGLAYDSIETLMAARELGLHKLCMEKMTAEQIVKETPANAKHLPFGLAPSYWQELAGMNVPAAWKQTTAPVLVIAGTSDYVSLPAETREVADVVNSFQPNRAAYVEIKDLDHELRNMPSWEKSFSQTNQLVWFGPAHSELATVVLDWAKKSIAK